MCKSHHKENEQASSQNASTPLSTSTEIDIVTSHRSVCKMNHLLPVALVRCLPSNWDIQIPHARQFARRGMDACDEALGGPGAAANWFGNPGLPALQIS